jgi:hypothetical protein
MVQPIVPMGLTNGNVVRITTPMMEINTFNMRILSFCLHSGRVGDKLLGFEIQKKAGSGKR